MLYFILIFSLVLLSFFLQGILSKLNNKWYGLILPTLFVIITTASIILLMSNSNYTYNDYAQFFVDNGMTGVIAQFIKVGIIYIPVIIHLIIYFVCRKKLKTTNT